MSTAKNRTIPIWFELIVWQRSAPVNVDDTSPTTCDLVSSSFVKFVFADAPFLQVLEYQLRLTLALPERYRLQMGEGDTDTAS